MLGTHTVDTITVNSTNLSPTYSISNVGLGTTVSSPNITTSGSWNSPPAMALDQHGTIDLRGENADIRVNGESLMKTLQSIQDRLNMLRPNTELEAEWDQLKELGDQYRKLEAEFKEKSKMWNALKK